MNISMSTVRKRLFDGESLSSFMHRLAEANGVPFLSFWKYLKKQK